MAQETRMTDDLTILLAFFLIPGCRRVEKKFDLMPFGGPRHKISIPRCVFGRRLQGLTLVWVTERGAKISTIFDLCGLRFASEFRRVDVGEKEKASQ